MEIINPNMLNLEMAEGMQARCMCESDNCVWPPWDYGCTQGITCPAYCPSDGWIICEICLRR